MNDKLKRAMAPPMRTILAVRACFEYCENLKDVQEVIKRIPVKYGAFEISEVSEEDGYFMVQNFFEKYGDMQVQQEVYYFYKAEEATDYDKKRNTSDVSRKETVH